MVAMPRLDEGEGKGATGGDSAHMAVISGKAFVSAQWLGTGPEREFPYRSRISRLGHLLESPQAAGRGPPK